MKTYYVSSEMAEIGKHEEQEIGTGEFKKILLGKKREITKKEKVWIKTGHSDCIVDGEATAKKIQDKCEQIEMDGLTVYSIEPINSGNWKYETGSLRNEHGVIIKNQTNAGGWGYGYGFSYTSGYIIMAQRG